MKDKFYKAHSFRLDERTKEWLDNLKRKLGKSWNLTFVYLRNLDEKGKEKMSKQSNKVEKTT